ncbi:MAG: aminotransferase class IV [Deltaproteobacteria bacterium]|nr:aminotransferase class IV [Deltaproteobacteria bacterium]
MGALVNLNGALVPPDRAFISIFDRGFLYGDSIYEVCRTYRGKLFELQAHLDRLQASADRIGLELPMPIAGLGRQMAHTLEMAELPGEAYVRLIVTRGSGEISLDPNAAVDPAFVIIAKPLTPYPPELLEKGCKVAVVGVRRNPRQALDPAAKTGNYLNSVLAMGEAKKAGAHEAILLGIDGGVTEGASSNVFLVQRGTLVTPALEVGILAGVTRRIVLELARELKIPVQERRVEPAELENADEAFLASSIREVMPIARVDDKVLAAPGPLTTKLRNAFRALTEKA